jgi:16S rRNA G966 N2-methylase RsmD
MLDPFCGAGGNTIAFALSGRWKRVYAIEKDPATLECAMQNARIYGVHDQITWFEGDCFEILGLGDGDKEKEVGALKSVIEQYGVVFASPPWGGESLDLQNRNAIYFRNLSTAFDRFSRTGIQERVSLQPRQYAAVLAKVHVRKVQRLCEEHGFLSATDKRSATDCGVCGQGRESTGGPLLYEWRKSSSMCLSRGLGHCPPWVEMKQITKVLAAKACTTVILIGCAA